MEPPRTTLGEHARKAPLAASGIQNTLAAQIAEVFENQLNVIDPRIDGRWKILFIGRCFIEVLDDIAQWNRRRLWLLPEHQPRVRKIGSPVLLA